MKNQLRHLSLTTRLSIAFRMICCTVFFAIGLLSYHNMQHLLAKQRDQNLTARVERIEFFLQDHPQAEFSEIKEAFLKLIPECC